MTSDVRFRVVVLGAARVGKTCIISRFLSESFADEYKATVDEFREGELSVGDVAVPLGIIDAGGSSTAPAIRRLSIGTADGVVLVYSVDDAASFDAMLTLRQQVVQQKVRAPIVVVGNKSDVRPERRAVGRDVVRSKANDDWNRHHVEVSAKDDVNIDRIFTELLLQYRMRVGASLLRRHSDGEASRAGRPSNASRRVNRCCTIV